MNGNILANRSAKDRNQVDFYETPPPGDCSINRFSRGE